MGRFNRTGRRTMPTLNTSSLPDLIFTLLFFFMIVTTMREVKLKVEFTLPQATQLERLEKKSLVTFIYVGRPASSPTPLPTSATYAPISKPNAPASPRRTAPGCRCRSRWMRTPPWVSWRTSRRSCARRAR